MASALLQAEIDIDASPEIVWNLIADLSNMSRWSPQCRWMKSVGPLGVGKRTINLNRRKRMFWITTSIITEYRPNQKLAFRIRENHTEWSYTLVPIPSGTRLIERRRGGDRLSKFSTLITKIALGGSQAFEQELLQGMHQSLQGIKEAAMDVSLR